MARVLLATDVEPARNQVAARLALEATGHVVDEVHDGFEALAAVATRRPDVLVLDTSLSGLDGFQVLTRLRRDAALRELPVVVLSSMPRDVVGELAHSLGAVRFVRRPFTVAALDEALAAALAGSASARANERPAPGVGLRPTPAPVSHPPASSVVGLRVPPARRARPPRRRPRGA